MKKYIILTLAVFFSSVFLSSTAFAYWTVKCSSGTVQKGSGNKYRCKVSNGYSYTYKKASCPPQTPYLVKKTHHGYNYACGLDTKVIGELWNTFNCPSGYSKVKTASSRSKTCKKKVPKYKYLKPHF